PWMLYLGYGAIAAIGFGTVANHVVSTAVAAQFERHRGLAVGIATAGSTAGQLAVVPVLALMIGTAGWRASYLTMAIACTALAPLVYMLVRRSPAQRAAARAAPRQPLAARLGLLARSPVFHALFWSFTICGFTTAGVIELHL